MKKKEPSFSEEKEAKRLSRFSPGMVPSPENGEKFFGSFFQERTAFIAHRASHEAPRQGSSPDRGFIATK